MSFALFEAEKLVPSDAEGEKGKKGMKKE